MGLGGFYSDVQKALIVVIIFFKGGGGMICNTQCLVSKSIEKYSWSRNIFSVPSQNMTLLYDVYLCTLQYLYYLKLSIVPV